MQTLEYDILQLWKYEEQLCRMKKESSIHGTIGIDYTSREKYCSSSKTLKVPLMGLPRVYVCLNCT
jgi:hypothetical protein